MPSLSRERIWNSTPLNQRLRLSELNLDRAGLSSSEKLVLPPYPSVRDLSDLVVAAVFTSAPQRESMPHPSQGCAAYHHRHPGVSRASSSAVCDTSRESTFSQRDLGLRWHTQQIGLPWWAWYLFGYGLTQCPFGLLVLIIEFSLSLGLLGLKLILLDLKFHNATGSFLLQRQFGLLSSVGKRLIPPSSSFMERCFPHFLPVEEYGFQSSCLSALRARLLVLAPFMATELGWFQNFLSILERIPSIYPSVFVVALCFGLFPCIVILAMRFIPFLPLFLST